MVTNDSNTFTNTTGTANVSGYDSTTGRLNDIDQTDLLT